MRTTLAGAALFAALISMSACTGKSTDVGTPPNGTPGVATSGAGSSGATTGPSGAPVGGVDRKTVCAGYQAAQGAAEAKLVVVMPRAAEALGDPAKAGPVITELKAVLTTFETALVAEAARADVELRAAIEADLTVLRNAGTQLQAAGNDVTKALEALQTDEFKAAGEKVKAICEK